MASKNPMEDLNRKQKRSIIYKKHHMPVDRIYETKSVKSGDKFESKSVCVAYLSPTKGWRGNKKAIKSAGHSVKRKTIG